MNSDMMNTDFESPVVHNLVPVEMAEIALGADANRLRAMRSEHINNPGSATALQYADAAFSNFLK